MTAADWGLLAASVAGALLVIGGACDAGLALAGLPTVTDIVRAGPWGAALGAAIVALAAVVPAGLAVHFFWR